MQGVLYDAANRQVAILCNHQRSVSKSFQAAFEKLEGRVRGAVRCGMPSTHIGLTLWCYALLSATTWRSRSKSCAA